MRKKDCLTTILFLSIFVAASQAGVLFSDEFTYPNGPLVKVSGGRWKTHSGSAAQVQVTSGQVTLSQRHTEDVSAAFEGGPISPQATLAVYARFKFTFAILPTGSNGTYFAHFKDAGTTGFRCRIFASTNGAASESFRLGISAGSNSASAVLPKDLKLHTSYSLVCRMILANNTSTLWVNPRTEGKDGATSTDTASVKTAAGFAFRQSLASGVGMGEVTVDDLIIGTTFADVLRVEPRACAIRLEARGPDVLRLSWPAEPEQSYSVWTGEAVLAAWMVVAPDLRFPDGVGWFEEPCPGTPMRFYRVSSP